MKNLDYLRDKRPEISNVFNIVEDNSLQGMKIVHHYANGRSDWSISEHQNVNPSREVISILYGKHKRFTFVHPVLQAKTFRYKTFQFSLSLKSELNVNRSGPRFQKKQFTMCKCLIITGDTLKSRSSPLCIFNCSFN